MSVLLMILGFALIIVGLVCSIIILIDAFQNEIWKGVVYLLCGIYALYYMLVEFDHENKWLIVAGSLLGGGGGYALIAVGGAMSASHGGLP